MLKPGGEDATQEERGHALVLCGHTALNHRLYTHTVGGNYKWSAIIDPSCSLMNARLFCLVCVVGLRTTQISSSKEPCLLTFPTVLSPFHETFPTETELSG